MSWFQVGISEWIYQYCPECFWTLHRPSSGVACMFSDTHTHTHTHIYIYIYIYIYKEREVCICVCTWGREKERERESKRRSDIHTYIDHSYVTVHNPHFRFVLPFLTVVKVVSDHETFSRYHHSDRFLWIFLLHSLTFYHRNPTWQDSGHT